MKGLFSQERTMNVPYINSDCQHETGLQFKSQRPTKELMRAWWPSRTGLGIVAGKVSGDVECIDFDCRETYLTFCETARSTGLGELLDRIEAGYCDDTPGGIRWLFRCPGAKRENNQKLARRPKRPEEKQHERD